MLRVSTHTHCRLSQHISLLQSSLPPASPHHIPLASACSMLTESDHGRIMMAYEHCGTVAEAARMSGFSRKAVTASVRRGFKPAKYKRAKKASIRQRVRMVARIASEIAKKQHRSWPRSSSSRQIRAELAKRTGTLISISQVQRDLHCAKLKAYVRPSHPTRSRQDQRTRREFARKPIPWRRIVFSDESWLCCNERTGRIQWSKSRKKVLPLEKKARWNVASIMVWGCVGYNFKGPLIIFPSKVNQDGELRQFRLDAQGYVRRCLSTVAPRLVRENRVFQQDGARSHAARSTIEYLHRKGVDFIASWPPYSPDLNAIERVWKDLNTNVGARSPMNVEELMRVALEEWEKLPQSLINAHCAHFPKQLAELAVL